MSNQNLPRISGPAFEFGANIEAPRIVGPSFSPLANEPTPPPEPAAEPEPPMTRQDQAIDFLKSAGLGTARGFVGMPGLPGSLAQMVDVAPIGTSYYLSRATGTSREAAQKAYDEAMEKLRSTQTPEEQAGRTRNILGIPFPTSQGMVDMLRETTGADLEYRGRTPASRVAGVAGEFFGGIPAGAPVRAAQAVRGSAPAARSMARTEVIPTVAAGTASGTLGEVAASTPFGWWRRSHCAIPLFACRTA